MRQRMLLLFRLLLLSTLALSSSGEGWGEEEDWVGREEELARKKIVAYHEAHGLDEHLYAEFLPKASAGDPAAGPGADGAADGAANTAKTGDEALKAGSFELVFKVNDDFNSIKATKSDAPVTLNGETVLKVLKPSEPPAGTVKDAAQRRWLGVAQAILQMLDVHDPYAAPALAKQLAEKAMWRGEELREHCRDHFWWGGISMLGYEDVQRLEADPICEDVVEELINFYIGTREEYEELFKIPLGLCKEDICKTPPNYPKMFPLSERTDEWRIEDVPLHANLHDIPPLHVPPYRHVDEID